MHNIPNRIADVLLQVEATLRFEEWLQWIFLPWMKTILEDGKPLPQKSAISSCAEHCLHKDDPPTTDLLKNIRRFDELIAIQSAYDITEAGAHAPGRIPAASAAQPGVNRIRFSHGTDRITVWLFSGGLSQRRKT
jgi:hypothetical protein